MIYGSQHNGFGKIHLIDNDNNCICGVSSVNMLNDGNAIEIINGNWFEIFMNRKTQIERPSTEGYCKKCINKVK